MAGKTVGDVLDEILSNPKRWFALLGLLVVLAGLTMLVMIVFTRLFGVETKEVRFGGTDSHIIFESIEKRSGNGEFVVLVNPQGWQRTGIEVHPGDSLSFYAGGKICIDVHDILEKSELRLKYEKEWAKKEGIRTNDSNEKKVPEDYFTDEERRSLLLNRPWVDPEGFSLDKYQPTFRSRRSRYLLPDENAAGLVAAVKSGSDVEPTRSDAFFVGKLKEDYQVSQQGWLWFTVNDAMYSDLTYPKNSLLFYNDNFGTFWVRVVRKRD